MGAHMSASEQSKAAVRLLILSDLHLEFATFQPPDPTIFDVVVLAGDICAGTKAVQWAKRQSTFGGKPVVLVPGNHEFYGSERTGMLARMRGLAAGSNVHLLDRDETVLSGVRFLGVTLWTDFKLDEAQGTSVVEARANAMRGLNDFSGRIREHRRNERGPARFMPEDAAREHELSRAWLQQRLDALVESTPVNATVVVTHHAPSSRSMDAMYEGSELNPCFYSELPETFFQAAALWIHGHTHSSSGYVHHRTRVVANPRGYMKWNGDIENKAFRNDLVITLDLRTGQTSSSKT